MRRAQARRILFACVALPVTERRRLPRAAARPAPISPPPLTNVAFAATAWQIGSRCQRCIRSARESCRSPPRDAIPVVALTFDDGPSQWTLPIAEALERHGSRGTFFALGDATAAPGGAEILGRLVDAGHEVGDHTFARPRLRQLTDDAIRDELTRPVTCSSRRWDSGRRAGGRRSSTPTIACARQWGTWQAAKCGSRRWRRTGSSPGRWRPRGSRRAPAGRHRRPPRRSSGDGAAGAVVADPRGHRRRRPAHPRSDDGARVAVGDDVGVARGVTVVFEDVVVIGGGAIGVCCAEALARAGRSVLLLEQGGALLRELVGQRRAADDELGRARGRAGRDAPGGALAARPRRTVPAFVPPPRPAVRGVAPAVSGALQRHLRQGSDGLPLRPRAAEHAARGGTGGGVVARLRAPDERSSRRVRHREGARRRSGRRSRARRAGHPVRSTRPPASARPRASGDIEDRRRDSLSGGRRPRSLRVRTRGRGARPSAGSTDLRAHAPRPPPRRPPHRSGGRPPTIRPELVVLAAGAWTPRLLPGARHGLLVEAGRGFSLTCDAGSAVLERPLRLGEIRTIVRLIGDQVRVRSKLDLVGLDERDRRAAGQVGRRTGRAVRAAADRRREGTGLGRPAAARAGRAPVHRAPPAASNVIVATGHGHLGISLAAVTGEAVAGIVPATARHSSSSGYARIGSGSSGRRALRDLRRLYRMLCGV